MPKQSDAAGVSLTWFPFLSVRRVGCIPALIRRSRAKSYAMSVSDGMGCIRASSMDRNNFENWFFPHFVCQQMGSASLYHFAHMAWGCWYFGLVVRTRGTSGYVVSSLVHHRPCPWLILVILLPLYWGPSKNHNRLGMVGLVGFVVVLLCHQNLSKEGGVSCRLLLFLSLWCWTSWRSLYLWM